MQTQLSRGYNPANSVYALVNSGCALHGNSVELRKQLSLQLERVQVNNNFSCLEITFALRTIVGF